MEQNSRPRRMHRSRGTAMTEMILVLPVLMLVLALVFYFGRAMVRVQRAVVMDRYETWRRVADAPGPLAFDGDDQNRQLNTAFFAGNASSIHGSVSDHLSREPSEALYEASAKYSSDTSLLVEQSHDSFVNGMTVRFNTHHQETIPLWAALNRSINHSHTRIQNDWRFVNGWDHQGPDAKPAGNGPSMLPEVRDVFLLGLDDSLQAFQSNSGNHLAGSVRRLYLERGGYCGPTLNLRERWHLCDR